MVKLNAFSSVLVGRVIVASVRTAPTEKIERRRAVRLKERKRKESKGEMATNLKKSAVV